MDTSVPEGDTGRRPSDISPGAQLDERVLGAGTTLRFALLVALIVAASTLMLLYVGMALSAYDGFGCSLAAGIDPLTTTPSQVIARRSLQWEAYYDCTLHFAAPLPLWITTIYLLVLAGLAGVLFLLLPVWKARRGRVVPLEAVDPDGTLHALVADLAATAGLPSPPRMVVDPAAVSSAGAVVFGRNRRPTMCVHAGLLIRRHTDPEGFRAVVLHELAHIRNGDITVTYLTVALWRVFAALVLPPFLGWAALRYAVSSDDLVWSSEAPVVARGLVLAGLMVVLVHLARADVLRSREIYADRTALRWGADPGGWVIPGPDPAEREATRVFGRFAELWRTHPRWETRHAALRDPSALFGARALPMFLTGATAAVVNTHVTFFLTQYVLLSGWMQQAAAMATAALVAGVVGVALWRAVIHALLTSRRVPSGLRAGLWLGFGLTAGGLAAGQGTVNEWIPVRPEAFALVVLVSVAFAWWITQCAMLWTTVWPHRTLRPVLVLTLVAGCVVLSVWFVWWQTQGVALAAGWSPLSWWPTLAEARDTLVSGFAGRALDGPAKLSAVDASFTVLMAVLSGAGGIPLALGAVAALWVVPLLAWAVRPATSAPAWVRNAVPQHERTPLESSLPPLRRVLLPGVLGGLVSWAAVAGVTASLWSLSEDAPDPADFVMAYLVGHVLAVVVPAAASAFVAGLRVSRHRALSSLVSAQTAVLVGTVGVFVVRATEGCLPLGGPPDSVCTWRPGVFPQIHSQVLVPALWLATAAAAITTLAVVLLRRRSSPDRPPVGAVPSRGVGRPRTRRAVVLVLAAAGFAPSAYQVVQFAPAHSRVPDAAFVQASAREKRPVVADAPVSEEIKALQVDYWLALGGDDLLDHFSVVREDLFDAVTTYVNAGGSGVTAELRTVRPLCAELATVAQDAARYFHVPDPYGHQLWRQFVTTAWQGGQGCLDALDAGRAEDFDASMRTLAGAQATGDRLDDRIDTLRDRGGL